MRQRCSNPNQIRYGVYGGRGIKVCEEWDDFRVFYEWAKSSGYSDFLTIDRIDCDKGYEPSNCRWVTQTEQQNNRRNNRLIVANGESHTLAEWSRITGVKIGTLWARLKAGHSPEEALIGGRLGHNSN